MHIMKKILFTLLTFLGLNMALQAQTKPVLTATIKTPNALCQQCKERIEAYLKRYDQERLDETMRQEGWRAVAYWRYAEEYHPRLLLLYQRMR